MTPAEIVARLTPAQRRALLWLPGDGGWSGRRTQGGPSYRAIQSLRKAGLALPAPESPHA